MLWARVKVCLFESLVCYPAEAGLAPWFCQGIFFPPNQLSVHTLLQCLYTLCRMQPHALTPVRMLNKPSSGSQITGWMHGNSAHFKPTLRQNAAAQATGELKTATHAIHLFQNRCAAPLTRETHKDEEMMLCARDSVTRRTWYGFNTIKILQNPLFH